MTQRTLTRGDLDAIQREPWVTQTHRMLIQDRIARGEWVITDPQPETPVRATATA
jgi:hypothetical protein